MDKKLNRLSKDWEKLARNDVFWGVLSNKEKKGGKWSEEEFYKRGEKQISRWMGKLKEYNIKDDRALDFGCGPGRLSFPLGRYFKRVDGVDISENAIDIARSSSRKPQNIHFHLNQKEDLRIFEDDSFDFILSLITLQHIPPASVRHYITEFHRILKPGGHLLFQLPSEVKPINLRYRIYAMVPNWLIRLAYRWFVRDPIGYMEMNGVPLARMRDFLSDTGFRVIRVWEDQSAGPAWESFRYFCVKD